MNQVLVENHKFIFFAQLIMLLVIMTIIRKIKLMKNLLDYLQFLMEFKKLLLNYLYVIIQEKDSLTEELQESLLSLEDQDLATVLVILIQEFSHSHYQEKIMMSHFQWKSHTHVLH